MTNFRLPYILLNVVLYTIIIFLYVLDAIIYPFCVDEVCRDDPYLNPVRPFFFRRLTSVRINTDRSHYSHLHDHAIHNSRCRICVLRHKCMHFLFFFFHKYHLILFL